MPTDAVVADEIDDPADAVPDRSDRTHLLERPLPFGDPSDEQWADESPDDDIDACQFSAFSARPKAPARD